MVYGPKSFKFFLEIYLLTVLSFIPWINAEAENVLLLQQPAAVAAPQCAEVPQQYAYHAPARFVPPPDTSTISEETRLGFLNLFRRSANPDHIHNNNNNNLPQTRLKRGALKKTYYQYQPKYNYDVPETRCKPTRDYEGISQELIDQLQQLVGINSQFAGFNHDHATAANLLAQAFANATTPDQLYRVARDTLYTHQVNLRLWVSGLVRATFHRPGFQAIKLPTNMDTWPDYYITLPVLQAALQGSSRPLNIDTTRTCQTLPGILVRDFRFQTWSSFNNQTQPFGGFNRRKRDLGQPRGPPLSSYRGPYSEHRYREYGRQTDHYDGDGYQELKLVSYPFREFILNPHYSHGKKFHSPPPPPPPAVTLNNYEPFTRRDPCEGVGSQGEGIPGSGVTPVRSQLPNNVLAPAAPGATQNQNSAAASAAPQSQSLRANRRCVPYNGTQGASGGQNALWYFREDIMLNEHHWYWHQYLIPQENRAPDRRGEQFYHTHHQLIARYNAERLSNGFPIAQAFDQLQVGVNIGEGYDSLLGDRLSGQRWTPRLQGTPFNDISHFNDPAMNFTFPIAANLSIIRDLLVSHSLQGFLLAHPNRSRSGITGGIPLDIRNGRGVSHLGDTLEADTEGTLNVNPDVYTMAGFHNTGHVAVSLATDPDYRCNLSIGVMGDVATAVRDPAFYRLHSLVDVMFDQHKQTLGPYGVHDGEWPLKWEGVTVHSVELLTGVAQNQIVANHVRTFWNIRRHRIEEGVDGLIHEGDVDVDVCVQHLNHEPFTFSLVIDLNTCARTLSRRGMVRIFMAPRFNEQGRRHTMEETRKLMFQMDVFPVELGHGRNIITRSSQDSSLTKPWSRGLEDILRDPGNGGQSDYCGCGYPRHLYLPKGTVSGMQFDLFAMVTNYDEDVVLDDVDIPEPCNSAYLTCGVPFHKYPDRRPMGYPFDRRTYSLLAKGADGSKVVKEVESLEEYVTHIPNSATSIVTIQHVDAILPS